MIHPVLRAAALPGLAAVLTILPSVGLADPGAASELSRYFTAEAVAERDAYLFPLYVSFAVEQVWFVAFVGLFLGFQLNRRLKARCDRAAAGLGAGLARARPLARIGATLTRLWGDQGWGGAMLFVCAYLGIAFFVKLPSDFYFEWIYERRHGLSVESLPHWAWDTAKAFALNVLTISGLAFGLYGLARRVRRWWLVLGVPCALLLLGAGVLDPYRVQIYRDYIPLPEGPARTRIIEVLAKARVEYEDVYGLKMDEVTRRGNAFVAGQGPSRRIVVYDTLLKAMTPDEVGNAIAHELGHIEDRSPGRLLLAAACVVPYLWLLSWFLRWLGAKRRFGFDDDRDVTSLPAAFLLIWLAGMITGPAGAAYSRHLERRADRYALELLEQPEAFRSMMAKLALQNMADLHPPAWAVVLLRSHPTVLERIQAAEAFAAERGIPLTEARPELFSLPPEVDPAQARRALARPEP